MTLELDPAEEPSAAIEVVDLTDRLTPFDLTRLAAVIEQALQEEDQAAAWTISCVLTDDAHLRQLHRDLLADDSETDIMTFPYPPEPGASRAHGELVISVDRASAQAVDAGWQTIDELAFLAIHGVLHLCGWDDADDVSREAMWRRQREILERVPDVSAG